MRRLAFAAFPVIVLALCLSAMNGSVSRALARPILQKDLESLRGGSVSICYVQIGRLCPSGGTCSTTNCQPGIGNAWTCPISFACYQNIPGACCVTKAWPGKHCSVPQACVFCMMTWNCSQCCKCGCNVVCTKVPGSGKGSGAVTPHLPGGLSCPPLRCH
jgi:hypothetical protein